MREKSPHTSGWGTGKGTTVKKARAFFSSSQCPQEKWFYQNLNYYLFLCLFSESNQSREIKIPNFSHCSLAYGGKERFNFNREETKTAIPDHSSPPVPHGGWEKTMTEKYMLRSQSRSTTHLKTETKSQEYRTFPSLTPHHWGLFMPIPFFF